MGNLEFYLAGVGIVLAISIYASKLSVKFGVPLLLVFLGIGMLLGSDGLLGIEFDNPALAQSVGTIALLFILYDGGLSTVYKDIRPVLTDGILLATFGVLITAVAVACCVYVLFDATLLEALLLGSIVSSTDAAAVFAILRAKDLALKNNIGHLLELESGSNDPMAIFLTLTVLQLISLSTADDLSYAELVWQFFLQFLLGGVLGYLFGIAFPQVCKRLHVGQPGLYSLFSVAWLLFIFGVTSKAGGNGFLCIYLAGILTNREHFPYKQNIVSFHDAIAWMMQIIVFLTLGLLVFPSQLPSVAIPALILACFLMFVARPLSVFVTLAKSRYNRQEKMFISWVGLRGAVPIVLATYPYLEGLSSSSHIFNMVFFMVLVSVFVQGISLPFAASKLQIIDEGDVQAADSHPLLPHSGEKKENDTNSTS